MSRVGVNIMMAIFCVLALDALSQNRLQNFDAEKIIESVVENLENSEDATLIVEDLYDLLDNPLNINTALAEDFAKIHLLNKLQIEQILSYRKEFGQIYSIYELGSIDNLSPQLLKMIEPFIVFGNFQNEEVQLKYAVKHGKHQLLVRGLGTVQTPVGYQKREDGTIPYEGNRFRYYSRYNFKSRRLSLRLTAEKDPGESFFKDSNKHGFDFYSASASFNVNSTIKDITIGDFLIRSGQGLVLWQGYSMGKNIYSLDLAKYNQGVRGYTSVDENNFFRGVATTVQLKNVEVIGFYSRKNIDANVEFDKDSVGYFTSWQQSGYHRTKNEIADEKSVRDVNAGIVTTWQINNLILGSTFHYQQFNMPLVRNDLLYNKFLFAGNENYTVGVDYLFSKKKYHFFGEAAMSKSRGKAFVQGVNIYFNDLLQLSTLFRHYDKNYHALWSNGFSEKSTTNNETGLFFGIKFAPFKSINLSAYTDYYRSEWINFNTISPATGWDFLLQSDFVISDKLKGYIRYKNEVKGQKIKLDKRYTDIDTQVQKVRLHIDYAFNQSWRLQTRLEYAQHNQTNKESGYLLFGDISYRPSKIPVNFSTRLTYFNVSDYKARIYAYENDLLYTFSIPAFFDKGIRGYLNLKVDLGRNVDFWLKVSHNHYFNRGVVSLGYNKIEENNKTDIRFQVRLKI